MGFGSLITDAAGKLYDVSKGAFDSYSMKHQGRFDPGFQKLLEGSFSDGVKRILGNAGVTGEQLESWGSSGWQETIKQLTGAVGSEIAAAGAGAALGGPLGAALGIAMEGGQILHNLFEEDQGPFDTNVEYKSGQWVAIDNGMTTVTKKMHNVLDDAWARRRLVSGPRPYAPTVGEGEGLELRRSLSVGFVLGAGEDQNTITVFNLLKGRDEQKKLGEVRPLDAGHGKMMDNNEIWSEIRLLRFKKEESHQLDTDVPTDPGSEVIRDGQRYLVVESNGKTVLIENKTTGTQYWTTVDKLSPGRRTHNNTWNYQQGRVGGSFLGAEATITQGDWVWVKPESYITEKYSSVTRQLACVEMLDGHDVKGYFAVDGSDLVVADSDSNLRPVSDDLNSYLSSSKVFSSFKDATVRGHDTRRLAAGLHDEATLLCLGITPLDEYVDATEKTNWRTNLHKKWHEQAKARRDIQRKITQAETAGNQGLAEKLDAAEEAAALGESPRGVLDDVLSDGGYSASEVGGTPPAKGNSSLVMLGIAGAGLLFFLR